MSLRVDGDDVLLPVQAQPGARRDAIVGVHDGRLKMSVVQAAEKGKANREIIRVLAESLGVSRSQVMLRSGETVSRKLFAIRDVGVEQVRAWLERVRATLPEPPDSPGAAGRTTNRRATLQSGSADSQPLT
jgi:uncharacterized protein